MPSYSAYNTSGIIIPLGSCKDFAVLAGTAVSFNGALTTVFTGSVGVAPGSAVSGSYELGTGSVEVNSANAILCAADLIIAYGAASGAKCKASNVLASSDLAGLTLSPAVYCSASGFFIISASTLTLNGKGNSNAQWIFQTATTLTTATATSFILQNGAAAKNIYWAIGSSATIGLSSSFVGTILAKVSVSYGSTSTIVGRGLAMAAVSFASNSAMTLPTSPIFPTASPTTAPTNGPTAAAGNPTPAPSTAVITSLVVAQSITGISEAQSQSIKFRMAFQNTTAVAAKVPLSDVVVNSVSYFSSRRHMLSSGVNVQYTLTAVNGNTDAIIASLQTSSASMSANLASAGFTGAQAAAVAVTNNSPTSAPTLAFSTRKPLFVYASNDIIIGTTIGSFFFVVFGLLIAYCVCSRREKAYQAPTEPPRTDPIVPGGAFHTEPEVNKGEGKTDTKSYPYATRV